MGVGYLKIVGHGICAEADITVFHIRKGEFGFIDRTGGDKMIGKQKLETEITIRSGKIALDLNGLTETEPIFF